MKTILKTLAALLVLVSCGKTDQVTTKTWSYVINNETEKNVQVKFFSKINPQINIDTTIEKNTELTLFQAINDVSVFDNLTSEMYDSAVVIFEDSKKLAYTYKKGSSVDNSIRNILLINHYNVVDSLKNHTNYHFTLTNDDYILAE